MAAVERSWTSLHWQLQNRKSPWNWRRTFTNTYYPWETDWLRFRGHL